MNSIKTYPFESYFFKNYLADGEKVIILEITSIVDMLSLLGIGRYCNEKIKPADWVYILLDCAITFDFDVPEETIISIEKNTGQIFNNEFNKAVFDNYMVCAYEEILKIGERMKATNVSKQSPFFHRVFGLADLNCVILTYY